MITYDTLKAWSKADKVSPADLVALTPQNDPFYAGTPADIRNGQWFSDLWFQFGYDRMYGTVHLRRMHYQLVSQSPRVALPDGVLLADPSGNKTGEYYNTVACWEYLLIAAKAARYLRLVDADKIDDKRAPREATLTMYGGNGSEISAEPRYESLGEFELPAIPGPAEINAYIPYTAPSSVQVEIWCEKSTMNDVLRPLAGRHAWNVQTGVGELSIAACVWAIERSRQSGWKPLRILYVSDFDPAGQSMPVSAARKLEWLLDVAREDWEKWGDVPESFSIQVQPAVLTQAQVTQYNLPRTPIKETERRAGRFESVHGEGAVELDALQALHPGALPMILEQTAEDMGWYDPNFERAWHQWRDQVMDVIRQTNTDLAEPYRVGFDELTTRRDALQDEISERLAELASQYADLQASVESDLGRWIEDNWENILSSRPEEAFNQWPASPMFDSDREYLDQVGYYKAFQGK